MTDKSKYLWITDPHLNNLFPWQFYKFISKIVEEDPKGVFITGDISNGLMLELHLKILAYFVKCPIYFVLGNHDTHWSSREKVHSKVRKLCQKYDNLIWMEDVDVIGLEDEVAVIGADGFYDVAVGDGKWIKYTIDWVLTKEFRELPSMAARIDMFRQIADESCRSIKKKLEQALEQDYKTIYILTHIPPFREAASETMLDRIMLAYNLNMRLGETIKEVMNGRKSRQVHLIVGHTHSPVFIRVSRNIDCQVGKGRYIGTPLSQKIYL